MKKMIAALIALVMILSAVSAFAEISTYMLTSAQDAEGNLLVATEAFMFVIDDETNECAFGTEDMLEAGTWEQVSVDENMADLLITFEDGTQMHIYFFIEEDAFAFAGENEVIYVMNNIETLEAAAEAA